jgi:hypothetical protein
MDCFDSYTLVFNSSEKSVRLFLKMSKEGDTQRACETYRHFAVGASLSFNQVAYELGLMCGRTLDEVLFDIRFLDRVAHGSEG